MDDAASMIDEERQHLRQHQAHLENFLRPICKLPHEILSFIFELGLPSLSPSPQQHQSFVYLCGQLVLSANTQLAYGKYISSINATCRTFRHVLAATPRCWAFLSLSLGPRYIPTPLIVETRLSKSRGCSFDLYLHDHLGPTDLPGYAAFLKVLRQNMGRCRTLSYHTGHESKQFPRALFESLTADSLRHLQIASHGRIFPCSPPSQTWQRCR